MTNQDIIRKAPCPTCGAAIGALCSQGAGRLRAEPHPERSAMANKGSFTSSKNALGSMMSVFRKK